MENNESFMEGNGILVILFFLLAFGGGWGGFGGWGGSNAAMQGSLTRAELTDGLNFQSLNNDMRAMQAQNYEATNCLSQAILRNQYEAANGFCGVNRNIDTAKYDALLNTNRIENAIHCDGEATRAMFTQNTIQQLRDEKQALSNELQSAQLALANGFQTQNILGKLGRFIPYAGCGQCGNTYGGYGW